MWESPIIPHPEQNNTWVEYVNNHNLGVHVPKIQVWAQDTNNKWFYWTDANGIYGWYTGYTSLNSLSIWAGRIGSGTKNIKIIMYSFGSDNSPSLPES